MDIKRLIEEVERYPEIWNPKHSLYHHRPRLIEIWNKISVETGMSSKFFFAIRKGIFRFKSQKCFYRSNGKIEMEEFA